MTAIKARVLIVIGLVVFSLALVAGNAFAKNTSDKPGWGWGDTNHEHQGPPGQSVFPVSR
jgi:hypothetical protein